MPVAFDTHKLITRLIQGQMPLAQAEAVSDALKDVLGETIGQLATTTDLASLTTDIQRACKGLIWMLGITIMLNVCILGTLLLGKP